MKKRIAVTVSALAVCVLGYFVIQLGIDEVKAVSAGTAEEILTVNYADSAVGKSLILVEKGEITYIDSIFKNGKREDSIAWNKESARYTIQRTKDSRMAEITGKSLFTYINVIAEYVKSEYGSERVQITVKPGIVSMDASEDTLILSAKTAMIKKPKDAKLNGAAMFIVSMIDEPDKAVIIVLEI